LSIINNKKGRLAANKIRGYSNAFIEMGQCNEGIKNDIPKPFEYTCFRTIEEFQLKSAPSGGLGRS